MVLAERQATRLRNLLDITDNALDERDIIGLPRLEVRRHSPWPSSGASQWINGRWVIVLNASEPAVRQRFSLCHELKHIIDHRFVRLIYNAIPDQDRHRFVEGVCDYFAGCVLMPRPAVKRAWTTKTQRLDHLARLFHVSEAAMATRLAQIGLTEPTRRCSPADIDLAAFADLSRSRVRYQRTATPHLAATASRL
jgi:Zn-dependent peptidase ImmA (M78 family)